jgi:hypothetical protein
MWRKCGYVLKSPQTQIFPTFCRRGTGRGGNGKTRSFAIPSLESLEYLPLSAFVVLYVLQKKKFTRQVLA